jgi:3-polyprenyl-4-hydroxybenzoate decarboxylase
MVGLPEISRVPLVAAVSDDVPLTDSVLLLWGLFTRFDCARATFFSRVQLKNGHPTYEGALFVDATWKKGYPKALVMRDDVVKKVIERWSEYGLPIALRD